tara:strand:- start:556 stop:669 length:114 start_codon:yes stop_codon:yes gene_type:complete
MPVIIYFEISGNEVLEEAFVFVNVRQHVAWSLVKRWS